MKLEKVNELKGIYIKELSGKQLIEFYEFATKLGDLTPAKNLELACLLISMAVCDKEGKPLYTVETAMDLPATEITILSTKVVGVSGMGETSNLKNAQKDSSISN